MLPQNSFLFYFIFYTCGCKAIYRATWQFGTKHSVRKMMVILPFSLREMPKLCKGRTTTRKLHIPGQEVHAPACTQAAMLASVPLTSKTVDNLQKRHK